MQMDRCTGQSIGAIIRYLGAKREGGVVRHDTIADALKHELGNRHAVPPGTVLATTSGQLLKSHGVKLLLHIATVQGTPGKGYKFIDTDIGSYVTNLLQACDRLSRGWFAPKYRSIVMPIFGTGNAGERSDAVFEQLLRAAIRSLRETPRQVIDRIYFLAFWEAQVRMCDRVMTANPYIEPVVAAVSGQPILAKAG
jgi:O-acetyl-ADP-ribose deacetylase (regulator of RNase III)